MGFKLLNILFKAIMLTGFVWEGLMWIFSILNIAIGEVDEQKVNKAIKDCIIYGTICYIGIKYL